MRSPRATSRSARASLSRWSWNSSANPAPTWNGSNTGARSATSGWSISDSSRRKSAPATTPRKNWPSTPRPRPTLSSCSPLAGVNSGVSPTAPTTTSSSTLSMPGKTCPILIRRPTRNTSPMSSSLRLVPTGLPWPSSVPPTMKRKSPPAMSVPSCALPRPWLRSKLPSCLCPPNCPTLPNRSTTSYQRNGSANSTTASRSASVTAARTKLAPRIV